MNLVCKLSLILCFFSITQCISNSTVNATGINIEGTNDSSTIRKPNNFTNDKVKAKEWADNYYKSFNSFLTLEQKESIKNISNVEELMLWKGRNIDNYHASDQAIKEDILNIRKALSDKKGILTEDLVVYKNMDALNYLKYDTSYLFESSTSVNDEHFKEFKKNMSGGFFPALQSFELTNNGVSTTNSNNRIIFELTLPKGTNTDNIDSNTIFIQDSYGFEIDDISTVTLKNRKFIKIKAQLTPRADIESIIKYDEQAANILLNSTLRLPEETQLIKFRFEGLSATNGSKNALQSLQAFLNNPNMSNDLKQELIEFMLSNKLGSGLFFTDLLFDALDEAQNLSIMEGMEKDDLGLTLAYKYYPSYIFIQSPGTHVYKYGEELDFLEKITINDSLIHELGHVFDQLCGSGINYTISNNDTFNDIFFNEQDMNSAYGKTDSVEFWAEFFRIRYSYDPDTHSYYEHIKTFPRMKALFKELLIEEN